MSGSPPAVVPCSTCGTSLSSTGECVACLVRLGFDETGDEASVFGDYEIERRDDGSLWELGRGAMGVTYRAQDRVLNRAVALKIVEAPAMTTAGQKVRERFLREARATAVLRHPNVAGVFQFGASSASDRCYYAMELVEGETLEALVRREGPLPVETALGIATQVAHALIAAARHGLVHRDLKPGNIMLTRPDGSIGEPVVKVIDFGLAKAITESGNEMELTHDGFLGTPAFASPEQFAGAPADARSDIYSLGVTLWYALTGEVPYGGKTIEEIRLGRSELSLPVQELVARKLPEPVIDLLRRILATDPTKRPASARELMSAIEACRAQLGYAMPNETRKGRSKRKLLAFAALLVLCPVAFFAFRQSAQKPAPLPDSPPKSIAVLPFENRSDDKANLYFADGVQDEILTTLAKVADLKVISRTSVMQFRDAGKRNLPEIAQALGVAHVLEGTVQRDDNRVRVAAQLSDARTGTQLWAERYDGTLADLFAFQSEIAQKIARHLKVLLSPEEQAALEARPTRDPEAYDFYLRAQEIHRNGGAGGVMGRNALKQVPLLDEAVARDPTFVRALCLLARVHLQAYWYNEDRTPARLELARKALESAERLQPDNGEVHLARALFHYWGNRAYVPALTELVLAARSLPNDASILFYIAAIQRRQGLWDETVRTMQRVLELDPRNGNFALNLTLTYRQLRRYADARRVVDNFLAWQADDLGFQLLKHRDRSRGKGGSRCDAGRPVTRSARKRRPESDYNLSPPARLFSARLSRGRKGPRGSGRVGRDSWLQHAAGILARRLRARTGRTRPRGGRVPARPRSRCGPGGRPTRRCEGADRARQN